MVQFPPSPGPLEGEGSLAQVPLAQPAALLAALQVPSGPDAAWPGGRPPTPTLPHRVHCTYLHPGQQVGGEAREGES